MIADTDCVGADEAGVTTLGADEQVIGNTIINSGRGGIVCRYSPGIAILHNRVAQCGLLTTDVGGIYALQTDGANGEIGYDLISDIHTGGFGGAGIYLDTSSSDYIIHHNVVWNSDIALKLNPPSDSNRVYNNTLVGTQSSLGSTDGASSDMTGSIFVSNIFTAGAEIGTGATQSNNLFETTDPLFVSRQRHDYRLKRRSPAIDRGTGPPFTDGFLGAAPDVGAYEFGQPPFAAGSNLPVPKRPVSA